VSGRATVVLYAEDPSPSIGGAPVPAINRVPAVIGGGISIYSLFAYARLRRNQTPGHTGSIQVTLESIFISPAVALKLLVTQTVSLRGHRGIQRHPQARGPRRGSPGGVVLQLALQSIRKANSLR
jgi:hypothetical protein